MLQPLFQLRIKYFAGLNALRWNSFQLRGAASGWIVCIVFDAQRENMHSADSALQLDKKMADWALFKMKNGFPHEK